MGNIFEKTLRYRSVFSDLAYIDLGRSGCSRSGPRDEPSVHRVEVDLPKSKQGPVYGEDNDDPFIAEAHFDLGADRRLARSARSRFRLRRGAALRATATLPLLLRLALIGGEVIQRLLRGVSNNTASFGDLS